MFFFYSSIVCYFKKYISDFTSNLYPNYYSNIDRIIVISSRDRLVRGCSGRKENEEAQKRDLG